MKRFVVYPYKIFSTSAKKLQMHLGGLRVKKDGKYKPKLMDLIVNWGNSQPPVWLDDRPILNHPNKVKVATNKLLCFQALLQGGVAIPEFTTDPLVAKEWDIVVCRTLLTSNSGKGIILWFADEEKELPVAPLYVKYKKKRKEFRVHVFKGKVFDVVEKRKRKVEENEALPDTYIRSHLNGWVFCRENLVEPHNLRDTCIKAMEVLGLDFGAIDVIWNEKEDTCFILEVNTAPGIEGTTLEKYVEEIKECLL